MLEPKKEESARTAVAEKEEQEVKNIKMLKSEKYFTGTTIETPNYDYIEASSPSGEEEETVEVQPRKSPKFRLRLITVTYIIICAICVSWIISNAVQMNSVSSNISQTTTDYEVNLFEYTTKLAQLDNVQPSEDGTSLNPIAPENIFGLNPEPLTDPVEYSVETSWFDNFCNWLSSIFGG